MNGHKNMGKKKPLLGLIWPTWAGASAVADSALLRRLNSLENGHVCEQPAYLNQTRWMDKSPTFTSFLKLSDEKLKARHIPTTPMIDIGVRYRSIHLTFLENQFL